MDEKQRIENHSASKSFYPDISILSCVLASLRDLNSEPPSPRAQRVVNIFEREEGKTRSAHGHEFRQDNFSIRGVENGSMILYKLFCLNRLLFRGAYSATWPPGWLRYGARLPGWPRYGDKAAKMAAIREQGSQDGCGTGAGQPRRLR